MKLCMAMPLAIVAVALAGCSGTATRTATSSATGQAASRPSTAVAAGAGAPSCTTHACIAADMQKSLVGFIVKDKSIVVRAACQARTVQRHPGNPWTAKCTATYLDGTKVSRFANYLLAKRKITFVS